MFEVNESIFERATLVKVDKESIQLKFNGKIEELVIEEGESGSISSSSSTVSGNEEGTEFEVSAEELDSQLANLPRLLSEARAVPYFRSGKAIGMRLFAIRKNSLYEKVGLKNGDILLEINGTSLADPTQALQLFQELKSKRSLTLKIERKRSEKTINYRIR